MKLKRTLGTGKILLYSCGIVIALAGAVWLIVNGVYAVYISGKEPGILWVWSYTQKSVDIVTPWLVMAAAAVIYYRYHKMCSANNVSCTKQTAVFVLMSIFIPTVFAAADLLSAKLVMQPLYGGLVLTGFEEDSSYFLEFVSDYLHALDAGEDISSPYAMSTLLLIFALMAVHYYCFFLAGAYIMQCFRCGRKKTLIYYAATAVLLLLILAYVPDIDKTFNNENMTYFLMFISLLTITAGFLTDPIVFLCVIPSIAAGGVVSIIFSFILMTLFILITVCSIEILGLKQYPSRKHIKRALKSIKKTEVQKNDGQT